MIKWILAVISLAYLSLYAIADEASVYGDLAFAMRYSELCAKHDDWAVKLYEDFEKAGIDVNKGASVHMGPVNYNRGLFDGYVAATGDIAKACRLLKSYVKTKL